MKRLRTILEVIRSPERAKKLANYIYDKKPSHSNSLIPIHPDMDYTSFFDKTKHSYEGDLFDFSKDSVEKVPLKKLYTHQPDVKPKEVENKIDKKGDIPTVLHDTKTDTYHIMDGNHTANADKVLGLSHTEAKVKKIY